MNIPIKINIFGIMKNVLLFLSALLAFTSCTMERTGKPRSSGTTNEILVVTENKEVWNGEIGDTLRAFFGAPAAGVPQPEPKFGMINIPSDFLNKTYKKFHNILIVDINPDFPETVVETKKDLWSWPQRVIKITAPSKQAFFDKFNQQKKSYLQLFEQLEIERIIKNQEMAADIKIAQKLESKYGIYLAVPGGFFVADEEEDFIWLRHTVRKVKQDVELGILIYFYPYMDTAAFNLESIIAKRNQMTRLYVPGPSEGSYMKVAEKYFPPRSQLAQDFGVDYVVEVRGLWDVENDFMGGSFLSYTFVDEKKQRVVTLDGYVYNPNQEKTVYIRQLQAIFHTFRFPREN